MMSRNLILAIGWTLLILAGCSIPGTDLPQMEFDLFEEDKLIHFTLFVIFGWLWMQGLSLNTRKRTLWVLAGGLFYACFTEIYQGWLPWDRQPDPMDALANILGLICALAFFWWKKQRTAT